MIYLQLFLSFLKIGALSFGGGYAAMPLIEAQIVTLHGWLHTLALQIIRLIAALADLNADDLVFLQHIAHEHRHVRLDRVADAVCQPRVGLVHIVNAGHIALIVNADIDHTAVRIRKGDDFLVNIICQLGFKFHALIFVLHQSHLRVSYFYYTTFFI